MKKDQSIKGKIAIVFFMVVTFFYYNITNAQTNPQLITELFFESGFKNCKVTVTNNKDTLFSGTLTSDFKANGATKIVEINKLEGNKIIINACGRTKQLEVQKSKYYIIYFWESNIVVEVTDKPRFYG